MKKFKEFKSEQQYITEVGPIGAALMGAMGLWGAWKSYKKAKDGIKGFREGRKEKKTNKANGFKIRIKKFNRETGKIEPETVEIPKGDKRANVDNDGILKLEKEEQKKQDILNKEAESKWTDDKKAAGLDDKGLAAKRSKEKADADRMRQDTKDAGLDPDDPNTKPVDNRNPIGFKYDYDKFNRETGKIEKVKGELKSPAYDDDLADTIDKLNQKAKDAEAAYKKTQGVKDEPEDGEGETETDDGETGDDDETKKDDKTKDDDEKEKEDDPEEILRSKGDKPPEEGGIDSDGDANAYLKLVGRAPTGWSQKKSKTGKSSLVKKSDIPKKQEKKSNTKPDNKGFVKTNTGSKKVYSSNVLNFGEFITEDVMKDLKLATKSKKDSEITLDDGTEIPMDAFTAEILVKYIEGLSSSEKTRTIKQIQRTERAFMKVLGKAHEE